MATKSGLSGPLWVAGGSGLVGSAVVRRLRGGDREIVSPSSADCDLRNRAATAEFVDRVRPSGVVLCAAHVGGIGANTASPIAMLSDNVQIGTSVLDACASAKVPQVVVVGSAAMYPAAAPQPIREESLWHGPAEPAHEAYAVAKLASVAHVRAIRRELGLPYVVLAPCNIYGVKDNFDAENSHVIPALLRKFWEANEAGAPSVKVWGTGRQRREFVNSADLAAAVEIVLQGYESDLPLNVGSGDDVSIADIAQTISDVIGYPGDIIWDTDRPEGPAQRLIDSSRLRSLGWSAQVSLAEGLTAVRDWLGPELEAGRVRGWKASVPTTP